MRPLFIVGICVAALVAGAPKVGAAQDDAGPLSEFGGLVVGTWEADDGRHVVEWGVGRQLLKTQSFFPNGDDWDLVSEGMWWFDADADQIVGVVIAVGMPVERFEYVTEVAGSTVVHHLDARGPQGSQSLRETWRFDGDGYAWEVDQPTNDGWEAWMGGRYRRVR